MHVIKSSFSEPKTIESMKSVNDMTADREWVGAEVITYISSRVSSRIMGSKLGDCKMDEKALKQSTIHHWSINGKWRSDKLRSHMIGVRRWEKSNQDSRSTHKEEKQNAFVFWIHSHAQTLKLVIRPKIYTKQRLKPIGERWRRGKGDGLWRHRSGFESYKNPILISGAWLLRKGVQLNCCNKDHHLSVFPCFLSHINIHLPTEISYETLKTFFCTTNSS